MYIHGYDQFSANNGTMILFTICIVLTCISFSKEINKFKNNIFIKYILWLGKNSLGIFLIHPIIVAYIRLLFINRIMISPQLGLYIQVIRIITITSICVYVIKKIKVGKFILGN